MVTLGSGDEERNSLWRHPRRRYDAGPALRSAEVVAVLIAFVEERRGPSTAFAGATPSITAAPPLPPTAWRSSGRSPAGAWPKRNSPAACSTAP
ncbi:DUF2460 domain-containing protein [Methylobacterium tarhaniae]|uniref:DUF2460 domain-containing protein n=1 Tax=Methylobacterium tarhaniae TaxID=1187852 RepID=UPI001FDA35AF|nr:DUF2460 domain-containing protein [Methylobacterium tarhaniae]